jgi:fatty-acyl-CoA synthase
MNVTTVREESAAARILLRAGLFPPVMKLPRVVSAMRRSGPAGIADVFALRSPSKSAIVDDDGEITYAEFARLVRLWTGAIAGQLPADRQGTVGLMCRNSRYLMVAIFAAMGTGARIVFLNTDLGATQVAAVCERENIELLIHDHEFIATLSEIPSSVPKFIADTPEVDLAGNATMATVIEAAPPSAPRRPRHRAELVILTSGSTGTPKGASRGSDDGMSMATLAGLLDRIPLRRSDRIMLAPPAFHGWGLIVSLLALAMGATLVFQRRFDAATCTARMVEYRCTAMIAVPTMLHRMMRLDEAVLAPLRGRLRIVASGGARLETAVVHEVQQRLGPVLHNFYGSTETSYISIATPADLAQDARCAGRPALGVRVMIVQNGREVPQGQSGEIFVSTSSQITQYTDGRSKPTVHGKQSTGDVGHVDAAGRLYVEGRADGMIVSGGENIFPEEVELTLLRHPDVVDAKVIATHDDEFGQVLTAVVVPTGEQIDEWALRAHVSAELSRSWVPRRFVAVEEIPRTATGKVAQSTLDRLLAVRCP